MSNGPLQEIVAVLGSPAAGNPSQYLFERAFTAAGLDWRIITCDVATEKLAAAIAGIDALGFRGCLVGGPLRRPAISLVAGTSPTARFAGGIGLVERSSDGLIGHMTDGQATVEAIRGHVDPADRHAVIVGAGLTGRAVALELAMAGTAGVLVVDPDESRSKKLVEDLGGLQAAPAEWIPSEAVLSIPTHAAIVVNTIPTTSAFEGLRPDLVFADATPKGLPLQALNAAGCCIVDNLEIRSLQAAIEFRMFTGLDADIDLVKEALDEYLS
jgi:shikimate dehydrogenase